MSEQLIIKLNVEATALVCKLADGRLAVMHDTKKGESGPELSTIVDPADLDVSCELLRALTAVHSANLDANPKRSKRRKGVLKKDDDAKNAIARLLEPLSPFEEPMTEADISKSLGLTRKRTKRLLSEMCGENPLRVGPVEGGGWVPSGRFVTESSGPPL